MCMGGLGAVNKLSSSLN